jgi:hypothetical protein
MSKIIVRADGPRISCAPRRKERRAAQHPENAVNASLKTRIPDAVRREVPLR